MNLNLSLIISSIKTEYEFIIGNPNSPLSLNGICPYVKGFNQSSDNTLYIAHYEKFKDENNLPKHIICIGGGNAALKYFNDMQICAVIYPEDCDQLILFSEISELFLYFNQLNSNLLSTLVKDSSTQIILNCCADFFKAQVALYNSDFQLISYSSIYAPPADNELWNEILAQKRSIIPPIPREKVKMLPNKPTEFPHATYINIPNVPAHYNIAFDQGYSRFATMIVTETSEKLTDAQHWLVDYVADTIFPVISRRYNTVQDARNYIRTIISKSLRETSPNEDIIYNSLSRLGWKQNDNYQLIVVSLPNESRNISSYLYNYENIFADAYSDCIAIFYDGFLLITLHNVTQSQLKQFIPTLEKQLLLDNGICSISVPFCNFSQLSKQYNLSIIPIVGYPSQEVVRYYSNTLVKHLITELNTIYPVECICHPSALKLHQYDKENSTNYLITLETYLKYNKSLMAASEKLYIHRSTMTYRLKCIEKIVEINFDDSSERLQVLLSCIALRILF